MEIRRALLVQEVGDGTLGAYINRILRNGDAVVLTPGKAYLEYVEKPRHVSDIDHVEFGPRKL